MAVTYELWNTESRNRVAEFESRADAMAAVRRTLATHGRRMAEILALGTEDDDGEGVVIARGAGLVEIAEREAQKQEDRPTSGPARFGKVVLGRSFAFKQGKGSSGSWMKRDTTSGRTMPKGGVRAKYKPVKKSSKKRGR